MLEVGTRVRYIRDDPPDIRETGYYPPIGTLGTIIDVCPVSYYIQWDSGTLGSGRWYCDHKDVEPASDIDMKEIINLCKKCPRAERNCNNCEYIVALNNYHAALRELEEKSQQFAIYVKKTYGIDLYN